MRDIKWLEGIFDEDEGKELPSLEELKSMLYAWLT